MYMLDLDMMLPCYIPFQGGKGDSTKVVAIQHPGARAVAFFTMLMAPQSEATTAENVDAVPASESEKSAGYVLAFWL
jgi:hypothetical protein